MSCTHGECRLASGAWRPRGSSELEIISLEENQGWEGGSGWGTHINPWLIDVNIWHKPQQYCTVISLQLIKIIEGEKKKMEENWGFARPGLSALNTKLQPWGAPQRVTEDTPCF